jgi:hypothetical protein
VGPTGGWPSVVENLIAYNQGPGVYVWPGGDSYPNLYPYYSSIRRNAIHSNAGLGIDLNPQGVNPNDPGDADNRRGFGQNFPVLSSASVAGGGTTVTGSLNSIASATFQVELFANEACDASGYGEGQTYLGTTQVTTDASGNATFSTSLPAVPIGRFITATAASSTGFPDSVYSPSEFSACRQVTTSPPAPGVLAAGPVPLRTSEKGTTASFTLRLTSVPLATVTIPLRGADPTEGTVSPATLTFTPDNALTPQTVTVTGVDDGVVDGDVSYPIVLGPASSGDPAYAGLALPDVAVVNHDDDLVASSCVPRPPVVVQTSRDGPGRLRVVLTASTSPVAPGNRLTELRFQAGDNALVDTAGKSNWMGSFTLPLPDRPASTTFWVRRATDGRATTLPLVVVDDCGTWPTLVGGGTAAGF